MRSLIAVIITAACAISLSQSSALAQEIPQKKADDPGCSAHAVAQPVNTKFGEQASIQDRKQLEAGLLNGTIPHIAPLDKLELDEVVAIADGEEGMVYRIPIESEFSNTDYVLVQTSAGVVQRVAETHINQISESEANLEVWVDGQSEYANVVREEDASYSDRGVKDAWNAFRSCLNNAGVPMAVVTGISIACGILGAFTVGTGVPACVIGAAGVFSGTVSFCYGRALKVL